MFETVPLLVAFALLNTNVPVETPIPAPSTVEEDRPELPPVTVTARKWEEEAGKVPQGLSVLDEEKLSTRGIETVRDAVGHVPNLFVNEFTSRRLSFPTMRGIGSGQGDPAVTTYIGGVPQLTTSGTNIPLFDVERVEFLRGPQSTLYGRNALGGVIHVVPRTPRADFGAEGTALFGNYDLREYRASAGGAISEELRLQVSALQSSRDGYTDNDFTGNDVDFRDSVFGRAGLLWTPADDWELKFTVHGEHSRDGGFVLSEIGGLRDRPHHINQDFEGRDDRDILAPSLEATYFGDDYEVTTISAFQDLDVEETSDFDFSFLDWVRRTSTESHRFFNQEVRVSSAEGADFALGEELPMRWLVGVNLFTADSDRSAATEFRPGSPYTPGTDVTAGEFDDWGAAIFAQATVESEDGWEVTGGLRFDHEDKEADLRHTFSGFPVAPDESLDEDYDEVLPSLSVTRHLSDDALAYARVARGFKAGGFNLAAPADQYAFDPETSWTVELGAKATWLDDTLRASCAVFHIDWDDMQLSLFDALVGGYVDNAGAATSRGFEGEVAVEPVSGLEVSASFGYTDTEFDEYVDPYGVDVSGNRLAYAPEMTYGLGVLLSGGDEDRLAWFLHGAVTGVDPFLYDAANREPERYTLLDFRAGLRRSHWRLEAFVKNALDEEYIPIAFQADPTNPSYFVGESGHPLTTGVSLTGLF